MRKLDPKFILVGILILAAGCAVLNQFDIYGSRQARFPHSTHLEVGLDCGLCHQASDNDAARGTPLMPELATCEMCHADEDAYKKYVEPFVKDGAPNWTNVAEVSDEVVFSHRGHVDHGVDCGECHDGVKESKAVSSDFDVPMDECQECHVKGDRSIECETCHSKISRDWPPPTHKRTWEQIHGKVVRQDDQETVNNCELCHSPSYCADCHHNTEPADHTNFFRREGHGFQAAMDRERCMACHRADFCVACHQHTAPRSHTGAWGPDYNLHCAFCHLPLSDNGCYTCHKTAHEEGFDTTTPPSSHTAAWGPTQNLHCAVCHFPLQSTGCYICHPVTHAPITLGPSPPSSVDAHHTATDAQCQACHGVKGVNHTSGFGCRTCHKVGG